MTTKEKPATGCNREAGYGHVTDNDSHSPIHTQLKAVIASLALRGLIRPAHATWLYGHGEAA
jgi:hypothetical protein